MTYEEALHEFGLPALPEHRNNIRRLLVEATEQERRGEGQPEILRTLCVQLFSIGDAEDALLIWSAKNSSFDMGSALDIQFLCGAGLEATKAFLAGSSVSDANRALDRLSKCEQSGDFKDWSPQKTLAFYRSYYDLEDQPQS
jgi:hypothetical protein